ncbi:UPF0182 family protein [Phormidium tenue FACHB-886]|nr:UPF0182 family protein [Phormidium tenue FACHB-886]
MWISKQLRSGKKDYLLGFALLGGIVLLDVGSFLWAEGLWFQEVDYLEIFATRLWAQGLLGFSVTASSLGFLWGNLWVADRYAWAKRPVGLERAKHRGHLRMRWLLPLAVLISLLVSTLLLYHGQIALAHWHPDFVSKTALPPLAPFSPSAIWMIGQQWSSFGWQVAVVLGLAAALLVYPRLMLGVIGLAISFAFSIVASERWTTLLLALSPARFGQADPLFGRDISFYVFALPLWELGEFWLIGLFAVGLLSVSLTYLLSADSLSQGYFPGLSLPQQRHLYTLGGLLLLAISLYYWLDRYELLYSPTGAGYGASYTSANVELPVYTLLSGLALGLGLLLLGRSAIRTERSKGDRQLSNPDSPFIQTRILQPQTLDRLPQPTQTRTLNFRFSLFKAALLYAVVAAIATYVLPAAIQQFAVQPNELQLEQPYLRRTIELTRQGFGLNEIEVETFDPNNGLTFAQLQQNDLTVNNIRIWDKRPLLQTNRQLQRIRSYYEFPDADLDRYVIPVESGSPAKQQVLIAARELDYSAVPEAAQTWINEHLIYTHGYGFTVSPVNVVGEGGLPDYLIQAIDPVIADPRVEGSIPVGKPRIYYGELANTYVMTQTQVQELDYPSGSENVYNTYDGQGGVDLGHFGQRLLFAKHLRDWRMLLTDDFTSQTRLLFRRQIADRVRAIAPFLRYDSDPYLVVADTNGKGWERGRRASQTNAADESYLYWMIDAYTTSDRFPYADPLANPFNYIRNSVKVVVDAYHGSVNFYVADPQDPIIQAWQKIFPGVLQPLDQMPPALRQHIRYGQDLYQLQTEQLMVYHMRDPIVFYNREDQWRAPNEIYGNQEEVVQPYFAILKLSTGTAEEFVLLRPFTPAQRNNLVAWLAARSDGDQYGKQLLYLFPKQELVFGTEQIEARINQDPVISRQISLWNRQGSRAVQGNLLVIPIERSLLYIEPLYLEAEYNELPTLARVIVAFGNRIAMAETLERSLQVVFQPPAADAPIVRPVEEPVLQEE